MTRLVWETSGQQNYESGVDRGVFYDEQGIGFVWNGFVSVEETTNDGNLESIYIDGLKVLDYLSLQDFKANLTAFSSPAEFLNCVGQKAVRPGVFLTRQPRKRFGLAYRSLVGEDAYKIHIIYNATASIKSRSYKSINSSSEIETLQYELNTVPVNRNGIRPTAKVVLDSRKISPDKLQRIENILYGSEESVGSSILDGGSPYLVSAGLIDGNDQSGSVDGNLLLAVVTDSARLLMPQEILDILTGDD